MPTRSPLHALTRRQTLGVIGAAGATVVVGYGRQARSAVSCALTPANVIGPYFVEEQLNRADITVDPSDGSVQPGVPLRLDIDVSQTDQACAPAVGVQVDVWHDNARGIYSDEAATSTLGRKFLRGYQVTDALGHVSFTTIYPGWYPGRTIHIHVRLRAFDGAQTTFDFISQIYFAETVNDAVLAQSPYDSRGARDTTNATDAFYLPSLLTTPTADGSGGYAATFEVGVVGLPAGTCSAGVDLAAVRCETAHLGAAVTAALADGRLRRRLLRLIARRVAAPIVRAEALVVGGRTPRALGPLRRAVGGVHAFQAVLTSRLGLQGADASTRAALDGMAQQLGASLAALQLTLV